MAFENRHFQKKIAGRFTSFFFSEYSRLKTGETKYQRAIGE
jgi:hypothetical protein